MQPRDVLRQTDYEHYLLSLFLPAAHRPAAWSILAIAAEISSIPSKTHEPIAGALRLAWWRESLAELYSGTSPPPHPLLLAFAENNLHRNVPQQEWGRLIEICGVIVEEKMCHDATQCDHWAKELNAPPLHMLAALEADAPRSEDENYLAHEEWGRIYGRLRAQSQHAPWAGCQLSAEELAPLRESISIMFPSRGAHSGKSRMHSCIGRVVRALAYHHLALCTSQSTSLNKKNKTPNSSVFHLRFILRMILTK